MFYTSLIVALLLLETVPSLAAVDPNSLVLNDLAPLSNLAPNPSPSDAADNFMTSDDASGDSMTSFNDANTNPLLASVAMPPPGFPVLAADATTLPDDMFRTSDVLASGVAGGTADEAGTTTPGDNPISAGASTECLTDTPNARRRMRRGCITFPNTNIQQSTPNTAEVEAARKRRIRQPTTKQDSPGRIRRPTTKQDLPIYQPSNKANPDFKLPGAASWFCDPATYGHKNIPMCDSGRDKPFNAPAYMGPDIIWYLNGPHEYATLLNAYPWIGYDCVEPELTWCCRSVIVERPDRDAMHDQDHKAIYTAYVCVIFQGVGRGPLW